MGGNLYRQSGCPCRPELVVLCSPGPLSLVTFQVRADGDWFAGLEVSRATACEGTATDRAYPSARSLPLRAADEDDAPARRPLPDPGSCPQAGSSGPAGAVVVAWTSRAASSARRLRNGEWEPSMASGSTPRRRMTSRDAAAGVARSTGRWMLPRGRVALPEPPAGAGSGR